jgi:hypothetical protein
MAAATMLAERTARAKPAERPLRQGEQPDKDGCEGRRQGADSTDAEKPHLVEDGRTHTADGRRQLKVPRAEWPPRAHRERTRGERPKRRRR